MNWFRGLFGPKLPEIENPEQLREHLFAAVRGGDRRLLAALCREHRDAILARFPDWQRLPEPLRGDRARIEHYMQGLVGVAEFFANALGRPELLQRLIGTEESNPILKWQKRLQQAEALMGELRYREAAGLLADLLIDLRNQQGSAVDRYVPIAHGQLAACYFHGGESEKALPPMQNALALCEQHGDAEGVSAYLNGLYEVHRYLGQPEQAATTAERFAEVLAAGGQGAEAERWRKQARLVRAGEPLNRVVAVIEGRRFELDEAALPGAEGRVQFVFERNRPTLRPAEVLGERGERLAAAGNFDEALAVFREAAAADRFAPHPHYLEGLTLLHLMRPGEAVAAYETTEALAPGWFNCRADGWLARQLALGNLDQRAFLAVGALEDGPQPPAEKVRLAEQALAIFPDLAPLHLFHGKNLAALRRRDEARAAFRKGLACRNEPDVRSRLLVQLALVEDSTEEKNRLLREACDPRGHLIAQATAVLWLRSRPAGG
jgi:tetratricopeptide (TPR) repeat protein